MTAQKTRSKGASKFVGRPEPTLTGPDEAIPRVPVIEETLEVAKRIVDRGGVRVTKRVETREELIDEPLTREQVSVERRPINMAIADDAVPVTRQEGDTLIVPVIEEVLITVKRLVLVEEVRITRTRTTDRQLQTILLRKEHIEVERLAAENPSTVKAS